MEDDSKSITINEVSRMEVIDATGRVYVNMNVDEIVMQAQDSDTTLKIFVSNVK